MWFKTANEEITERSLKKFLSLRAKLEKLSKMVFATQSGVYNELKRLVKDRFIKSDKLIFNRLNSAISGENNQKIALDSPHRVSNILKETISILNIKIARERKKLQEIKDE